MQIRQRASLLKLLFMCMLLPYAPRITVVSGALCQALLVTLPVKIPHVPHVQSIRGGRMVLVGVVMVSWVCARSVIQSILEILSLSGPCMFNSLAKV